MKKITTVLLCMVVVLSVVGCDSGETEHEVVGIPCPECNGTGIETCFHHSSGRRCDDDDCYMCQGGTCVICDGNGLREGSECYNCDGTGEIDYIMY